MKTLILSLFILLLLLYCLFYALNSIKENNLSMSWEGVRIEKQASYPETNNPVMFGVTGKEYNAEVRK